MSVESFLTRKLDIRFIDARSIVNEAKVGLGIHGYPTKDQEVSIRKEACRIFCERSEANKDTMRRLSASLEAIKIPSGSMSSDTSFCSSSSFEEDQSLELSNSSSTRTTRSTNKRGLSLFRKQTSRC